MTTLHTNRLSRLDHIVRPAIARVAAEVTRRYTRAQLKNPPHHFGGYIGRSSSKWISLRALLATSLIAFSLAASAAEHGGAHQPAPMPQKGAHEGHSEPSAAPDAPAAGHDEQAAVHGRVPVELDQAQRQLINIRTTPVIRGPATVTIRAVGVVAYDESRIENVNTRIMGWAEKLYVDKPGQFVRAGDPLMDIYSPELYSAQSEYLLAYRHCERLGHLDPSKGAELRTTEWRQSMTDAENLLESARKRLKLWEITDEEIRALEQSGQATQTMQLSSPATGFVIQKNIDPAQMVRPGMTLYRVADLDQVWINVSIYEYELPFVKVGQKAVVTALAQPGSTYEATVDFIFPYAEARTRTTLVRLVVDNRKGLFKPDNYVNAEFKVDEGERLLVPDTAMFDTGTHQYVFVEVKPGHFLPRLVKPGPKISRQFSIDEGITEGEMVVVDGNFLLDSESQLRAAGTGGGHSGH